MSSAPSTTRAISYRLNHLNYQVTLPLAIAISGIWVKLRLSFAQQHAFGDDKQGWQLQHSNGPSCSLLGHQWHRMKDLLVHCSCVHANYHWPSTDDGDRQGFRYYHCNMWDQVAGTSGDTDGAVQIFVAVDATLDDDDAAAAAAAAADAVHTCARHFLMLFPFLPASNSSHDRRCIDVALANMENE